MLVGCIRAYYSSIYFEHVLKPSSFACVPIAVINLIPFLASSRLTPKLQATKASSKATTENKTEKGVTSNAFLMTIDAFGVTEGFDII